MVKNNGSSRKIGEQSVGQQQNQVAVPRGSVRQKIAMFENKINDQDFAEEEEQYDLTPVVTSPLFRRKSVPLSPAYAVDPFEFSPEKEDVDYDDIGQEHQLSPTR